MPDAWRKPERSPDDRLDRLVALYLQSEEAGQPLDPRELLKRDPDLQAGFYAFLSEHEELKRQRRESNLATLPVALKPTPVPQRPPAPPADDSTTHRTIQQGQMLGDCIILRELGRGGMGVVYLGRHSRLDALRAIKILPRDKVSDEAVGRFWREAQTAANIDHLNVITIHNVGQDQDVHFIVMPYIDGETLTQLRLRYASQNPGKAYPWPKALRLAQPVLDALATMHAQNLIHRDIKPSNIMVTEKSSVSRKLHVVLMDFGLVRDQVDARLTQTGAVVGTPAYMSPEQARGAPVDGRSDIYSVGATLYYLLTGRAPYEGHRAEVFYKASSGEPPFPLATLRPDIPPPVVAIVERAMSADPGRRFGRAEEMLKVIKELLRTAPKGSSNTPAEPPPPLTPAAVPPPAHHDTVDGCGDTGRDFQPALAPPTAPAAAAPALPLVPLQAAPAFEPRTDFQILWARWSPAAGALAIVLLIVGGLIVLSFGSSKDPRPHGVPPDESKTAVGGGARDANRAEHRQMVYIPAGAVHLGASEERLRTHAQALESIRTNPDWLENFVSFCRKEAEQTVRLKGFWIDKYEVTNEEYERFVKATRRAAPKNWEGPAPPAGKKDHPVTGLKHDDAAAYANWAGKKLPTVAQWTRAYRGADDRMYPWGDNWQSDRANVAQNTAFAKTTSSVTVTPQDVTQFGVFNMVGNASEMVRERTTYNGETATITKGADSQCLGDLYGAAPFQFFLAGEITHDFTGFRCVIEDE